MSVVRDGAEDGVCDVAGFSFDKHKRTCCPAAGSAPATAAMLRATCHCPAKQEARAGHFGALGGSGQTDGGPACLPALCRCVDLASEARGVAGAEAEAEAEDGAGSALVVALAVLVACALGLRAWVARKNDARRYEKLSMDDEDLEGQGLMMAHMEAARDDAPFSLGRELA